VAVTETYLKFIQDQLSGVKGVESKKMFGGYGFFKDGRMFGMIGNDVFRLKVDDTNLADFEKKGMKPYQSDKKKKGMPYWEVPIDIIEDQKQLHKWVAKAVKVAEKAAGKK
jgi:DNA transformation protein